MVTAIFIACNREFWTKIETNIKFGGDSQQVLGMNVILVFSFHLKWNKIKLKLIF